MRQLLRDPVWTFVFGFAAFVIALFALFSQRRKKRLFYEVLANASLLSISSQIAGKLQVLYEGRAVQNVRLLIFRLVNAGNVPILQTDYERTIQVGFGEGSTILSAERATCQPANLKPEYSFGAYGVTLMPLLLNPGDSITFQLLLSRFTELSVDARIAGVPAVRELPEGQDWNQLLAGILVLAGLVMLLIVEPPHAPRSKLEFAGMLSAGVGFLLLLVQIGRRRFAELGNRRKRRTHQTMSSGKTADQSPPFDRLSDS